MKKSNEEASKAPGAAKQLEKLFSKVDPKHRALARSVRSYFRKRFATADELVYDYRHSLVIAWSPTGRGLESPVSISASAEGVRLYFNNGPKLPDPDKKLLGSGKATRFVEIRSLRTVKHADTEGFVKATLDLMETPFPASGRGALVIKTDAKVSAAKKKKAAKARRVA
jgi:hypothetical protein